MRNTRIKIIGIMLCTLVLGTLVPTALAQDQQAPQTSAKPYTLAMVMGRITNVHKIGRIVLAHAVRLHYIGISADRDLDRGIIRGREVMFRDSPRFHMYTFGSDTMVLGRVLRLRVFI